LEITDFSCSPRETDCPGNAQKGAVRGVPRIWSGGDYDDCVHGLVLSVLVVQSGPASLQTGGAMALRKCAPIVNQSNKSNPIPACHFWKSFMLHLLQALHKRHQKVATVATCRLHRQLTPVLDSRYHLQCI
jgi:hypothetical protein